MNKNIKDDDEEGAKRQMPEREVAVGASHGIGFAVVASESGGRTSPKKEISRTTPQRIFPCVKKQKSGENIHNLSGTAGVEIMPVSKIFFGTGF